MSRKGSGDVGYTVNTKKTPATARKAEIGVNYRILSTACLFKM